MSDKVKQGRLVVVGTGLKLAAQATHEAVQWIENADKVFAVVTDAATLTWLRGLNPELTSLQHHYAAGKNRRDTYDQMKHTIMEAVRKGHLVCAVFYGHPGVFVAPSHEAVEEARAEGYRAMMLPGVSAEDCLFADLGIDPARQGLTSVEATSFVMNGHVIDARCALILWQIGIVGDWRGTDMRLDRRWLGELVSMLLEYYPREHRVAVYEALTLPIGEPRVEWVSLEALHSAHLNQHSTLYVPPIGPRQLSANRLYRLGLRQEDVLY